MVHSVKGWETRMKLLARRLQRISNGVYDSYLEKEAMEVSAVHLNSYAAR